VNAGVRALGVAESTADAQSTLAGAVVRADRVVDGAVFSTCTVGGTDATSSIATLVEELDREDVQYILIAGIALAWYNVVGLRALEERLERPVLSVSFEESSGLEDSIRDAFEGEACRTRLETYRNQPPRHELEVNGSQRYVRGVGLEASELRDVVRAFTPSGGRPEPVRVARELARAADHWHHSQD